MLDKIGQVLCKLLEFLLSLILILIFGAVIILVLPILAIGGVLILIVGLICWAIEPEMFKKKMKIGDCR